MIVVTVVIRMGRNRDLAAATMASITGGGVRYKLESPTCKNSQQENHDRHEPASADSEAKQSLVGGIKLIETSAYQAVYF